MTDIFSDTMFTAPPRQQTRVETAFIAYNRKSEADMAEAMAKVAAKENEAMGMTKHTSKNYQNCGMSSREVGERSDASILATVAALGRASSQDVAEHVDMNRNNISSRMTRLYEAGRLSRVRMQGKGTSWLYSVAQAKQAAPTARVCGVSYAAGGEA
jgi:predicted HTH transcriptional regulator